MVTARTLARLVRRLVTVALVVAGARSVLGVWLSSVVLTAAWLWFGLRAWHRWENRSRRRPRPLVPEVVAPHPGPTIGPDRHVAFARALGVVAAAYESECEQEARTR